MSTLLELVTRVSRELRDTNNATFTAAMVTDLINSGITEIGRIAPQPFQEDIEADGSLSYQLGSATADKRWHVTRAELWTTTPLRYYTRLPFAGDSRVNSSQAGWRMFNGYLELPQGWADFATAAYTLRVWGDKPYTRLVNDSDASDLGEDGEEACIEYAAFRGYDRMLAERALFKQWQTQNNNTDASFGGLMQTVSMYGQKWAQRRRQLALIRELV